MALIRRPLFGQIKFRHMWLPHQHFRAPVCHTQDNQTYENEVLNTINLLQYSYEKN